MLLLGQVDYLTKKEPRHEKTCYRSNRSPRCNVHQHNRICCNQSTDQDSNQSSWYNLCKVDSHMREKTTYPLGIGGFFCLILTTDNLYLIMNENEVFIQTPAKTCNSRNEGAGFARNPDVTFAITTDIFHEISRLQSWHAICSYKVRLTISPHEGAEQ